MKRKMVAGLDDDMQAKLFWLREDGGVEPIGHEDWCRVLDMVKAKPGEMLGVSLRSELSGSVDISWDYGHKAT